jgi:chondroitin-sulfate-ABC endolyase/exolyase
MAITGLDGLVSQAAPAPFEIQVPHFPVVKISGAEVPPEFSAGADTKLSTENVSKSDTGRSLRFNWDKAGAAFTWKNAEAFTNLTGEDPDSCVYEWITVTQLSAFSIWVFNEKALKDPIWFEIGTKDRVDSRFYMNLDFTGWRELKALYGRDIRAMPKPGADTLRSIAPANVSKGSLCFDLLNPRVETDVRFAKCTPEAPWVFNKKAAAAGGGTCVEATIEDQTPKTELVDFPVPAALSEPQLKALRAVTDKYMKTCNAYAPVAKKEPSDKELDSLRERYRKHQFVRSGNVISGQIVDARTIWGLINNLAVAWAESSKEPVRKELRQMSFDLIGLVAMYGCIWWYGAGNGFVRPLYLLRDELKTTGRWEPIVNQLKKCYLVDVLYLKDIDKNANADFFLCAVNGQVGAILQQDDTPQKWRDMLALQRFINIACCEQGCIMADGTIIHHNMNYNGYSVPAITPACWAVWLLQGTPFEAKDAHRSMRRAAQVMRFYACTEIPDIFSGRHRGGGGTGFPPECLRLMAEAGNPDTGEAVDREMAALYLWFDKKDEAFKRFQEMGINPVQPSGNLTLPFSVASFQRRSDWMAAVKGQKKYLGTNESYGGGANYMGRYCNYGTLVIQSRRESPDKPVNVKWSGFETGKGWDYNYWPGTTARVIPYDALRSHFSIEENITSEYYAAGTSLDGNGIFAMKVQEDLPGAGNFKRIGPVKWFLGEKEYRKRIKDSAYDTEFHARKSWFFFEERIVCLGSGITCVDNRYPIATTLFQNSLNLPGRKEHFMMDSSVPSAFPIESTAIDISKGRWMIDSCDNGYWIPSGNDNIHLIRARKSLPYCPEWTLDHAKINPDKRGELPLKENEGDMELAWFDHGKVPASAGYEYAVLVDTTSKKMESFAKEMAKQSSVDSRQSSADKNQDQRPYEILQKDAKAHIVWDRDSKTTGYAIFDASWSSAGSSQSSAVENQRLGTNDQRPATGDLLQASKPCLVMLRDTGNGGLRMSFTDPDMGLDPKEDKPGLQCDWDNYKRSIYAGGTDTEIVLKGLWQVNGSGVKVLESGLDGQTVLEIHCVASQPVIIDLNNSK